MVVLDSQSTFKNRLIKVLILFVVILIILVEINYYNCYNNESRKKPVFILSRFFKNSDFQGILSDFPKTPYLWSRWESWENVVKSANQSNSSLDDRNTVEITNWIKKLSKNDQYIKTGPIKKILLFHGLNSTKEELLPQVYLEDALLCRHKCHYYAQDEIKSEEVDAVVFISQQYYLPLDKYPKNALKVMLASESPIHVKAQLGYPNTALMSYYRDADIFRGYYTPWRPSNNKKKDSIVKNYAANKTRFAATFVSNCWAHSNRAKYVKELQTVISVDVYGGCGHLKCSLKKAKKCFEMLKKDYKFYLSFENSQCRGYITEKFFQNALQNDIIPIVLGATKEDYVAVGPPNSFIHIEDFKSPKELGEYLIYLDKNETAYNEYFEWKNAGDFIQMYSTNCRICGMTHYKDFVPLPIRPKESSLSSVNECLPQGQSYWNRHRAGRLMRFLMESKSN